MARIRTAIAPACTGARSCGHPGHMRSPWCWRSRFANGATAPAPPEPAPSSTSATIAPSLTPNRLGAKGELTITVRYPGGEFGVPSPVRRSVLRLPAG